MPFIAPAFDVPPDRPHFAVWPRRLPRTLVVPETSLWTNLEITAQRYPDKVAYLFFGRTITFRELKAQAEAIAGWLHAVAERLQAEFGLTFAEGYGLTETAAPTHANPPERAKLQCLGMPIFGVDSRVASGCFQ